MKWALLLTMLTLLFGAAAAFGTRHTSPESLPCFGAASRDPDHPCHDAALKFIAQPRPVVAVLQPGEPCQVIKRLPEVCSFGTAGHPTASIALVGDSHGTHWAPALAVAAAQRHWRVYQLTRDACPFTFAFTPGLGARCGHGTYTRQVIHWLRAHPQIHTLVVSANAGAEVSTEPGLGFRDSKVDGYRSAWAAVPSSIRTIDVVHDVPHANIDTAPCVDREVAAHHDAGVRCARPRDAALQPDLEADATTTSPDSRVRLIDLTAFMCDDARCFPVVGGALVIKDIGHMTRSFSATLGPYLRRAMMDADR